MKHLMLALFTIALLTACGSGGPSHSEIRAAFEQEMPGLLELKDFKLEQARNTGNDENPIWVARAIATVAPREATYEIDTVENGVRILKPVFAAGQDFTTYGTVRSTRRDKTWHHSFQNDGSSEPSLGRPRVDYGADALIAGSSEADALLAEIKREREEARIAEETRLAEEAAERKRKEEAEAAERQRIEAAVAKYGAGFAPESLYRTWPGDGKKLILLVTAKTDASTRNGHVYGTDRYGNESDFPRSVVHSGLLKPGETGIVEVTGIYRGGDLSQGSPRNGIDSIDTTTWNKYSIRLLERISTQ